MNLRPWAGPADTAGMQRVASRAWPAIWHPGGLGWEAASEQLPELTVVAEEGGQIVGWAGLAGRELSVQADRDNLQAAQELVRWGIGEAETAETAGAGGERPAAADLTVAVHDSDEIVRAAVAAAGFVPQPGAEPVTGMFLPTGQATSASPPRPDGNGYLVRGTRDDEFDARVEVHRAAWRPATLPWPGDPPPSVTPEVTSRFTARLYQQVRAMWLYDQRLDLVAQAPDGTLAACCIAWWDPATGCAEIEPLGVAPAHRRRGLATALCMAVAELTAKLGGDQVFINVAPRADYPAPAATYLAAGFESVSVGRRFRFRPG